MATDHAEVSGPGRHQAAGAAARCPDPCTGRDLVTEIAAVLGSADEARWIVAEVLGLRRAPLAMRLDEAVPEPSVQAARSMAARRVAGEPLQHVIGTWSFRTLEVLVDGRALVPRPETEQVVELSLAELRRWASAAAVPPRSAPVAVDLGTGSGVIALALAVEGPSDLEVWAVDRSASALALARANRQRLAMSDHRAAARVQLVPGSWFEPLPSQLAGRVQLVVSNPPYVAAAEWETLDPVVRRYDPYEALVPGPAGTEALSAIVDQARRWLAPGGSLVLELAPHQADAMRAAAQDRGYLGVAIAPDLAGRDRVLLAHQPGP